MSVAGGVFSNMALIIITPQEILSRDAWFLSIHSHKRVTMSAER